MKSFTKFLVGAIGLTFLSSGAQAQDLFTEAGQDKFSNPYMAKPMTEFRRQTVTLDQQKAAAAFDTDNPASELSLELFPGRKVSLLMTDFDPYLGEDTKAWSGRVDGFDDGSATFVYMGDRVMGHVQYAGEIYRITPDPFGNHQIAQLDLSTLPDEAPEMPSPTSSILAPSNNPGEGLFNLDEPELGLDEPEMASQNGVARIRVLVMYTTEAWRELNGQGTTIADEARLAIAMANTASANTALAQYRYQLAGVKNLLCNYDENAAGYTTLLSDVTNTASCVGSRADGFRTSNSADLVAILRKSQGSTSCGVAWLNENASNSTYGVSLTSLFCIPGHTFTHELGHNIGLRHDRYVENNPDPNAYNFGLAAPWFPNPLRTIMAYNQRCADQGKSCTRVPLYSNTHPNGTWNGAKLGRYLNQSGPAVNRKKILDNWALIAAWY